jgi:hypothetical protein
MSLNQDLVELKQALRRLIAILEREGWPSTSGWEAAVNDIDGILAGELVFEPEEMTAWVRRHIRAFGVGMGSLTDVYLGEDFDAVHEDVVDRLGRIGSHVRDAPGYAPRIRRYLTELEDQLLEASMTADASRLRDVLKSGPLDLATARAVVEDLVARMHSLPQPVVLALAPARAELSAAMTQGASG